MSMRAVTQLKGDVRLISTKEFATHWSLRFPLITDIRDDKRPQDVNTVEEMVGELTRKLDVTKGVCSRSGMMGRSRASGLRVQQGPVHSQKLVPACSAKALKLAAAQHVHFMVSPDQEHNYAAMAVRGSSIRGRHDCLAAHTAAFDAGGSGQAMNVFMWDRQCQPSQSRLANSKGRCRWGPCD